MRVTVYESFLSFFFLPEIALRCTCFRFARASFKWHRSYKSSFAPRSPSFFNVWFFPTSRVIEARLTSWSQFFYYNYSIKDGGVRLSPLGNLQCLAYVYRCRHHRLCRRYGHLCSNSHIDLSGSSEPFDILTIPNSVRLHLHLFDSPYINGRGLLLCIQPVLPVGRILLFHLIHGVLPLHGLVSLVY